MAARTTRAQKFGDLSLNDTIELFCWLSIDMAGWEPAFSHRFKVNEATVRVLYTNTYKKMTDAIYGAKADLKAFVFARIIGGMDHDTLNFRVKTMFPESKWNLDPKKHQSYYRSLAKTEIPMGQLLFKLEREAFIAVLLSWISREVNEDAQPKTEAPKTEAPKTE